MPHALLDLEPGEEVLAVTPASFRGAAATTARATFALGSARMRQGAFEAWRDHAREAGFPTAGPEMILAVTNQRLLAYFKTFWIGRPASLGGGLALRRIADVASVRHGLVVGCAFALENGQIIEVEAMRGIRLHRFARVVNEAKAAHTP